jgi:hypothetical protein
MSVKLISGNTFETIAPTFFGESVSRQTVHETAKKVAISRFPYLPFSSVITNTRIPIQTPTTLLTRAPHRAVQPS